MDTYRIDGHKLYWHLDRISEWQNNNTISPVYIEISPVSYCNHKCLFCGIDFAMERSLHLDTGLLSKRLREMGKLGVKSIMFAGEGEPMLHRDIAVMVREAKENGIDVGITTNGTAGSPETWREILPHLTWIKISADAGSPEVYSVVHNVQPEMFRVLMRNLEYAVSIKKEHNLDVTLGVQYLVTEENINDIRNAIALFGNMNLSYIVIKPYSMHPKMIRKRDIIYSETTMNMIQDIADEFRDNMSTEIIFRRDAMSVYQQKTRAFSHCHALPFWGYINSKGDFYTCSVFLGDDRFNAGNIYKDDMSGIFYGEKRKESIDMGKNRLPIEEECRVNCRMARINEFLEFLDNRPAHINFI